MALVVVGVGDSGLGEFASAMIDERGSKNALDKIDEVGERYLLQDTIAVRPALCPFAMPFTRVDFK